MIAAVALIIKNWKLAAFILLTAISFWAGSHIRGKMCENSLNAELAQYIKQYNDLQYIAKELEQELSKYRDFDRSIQRDLETEKNINQDVYRKCLLPAGGLHILKSAISDTPSGKSHNTL